MILATPSLRCVSASRTALWLVLGGKPGQWSARKAQMLAKAYKEKGGGYKGGKSKKQKDLKRWGKEKWMTRKEYEKKKDD